MKEVDCLMKPDADVVSVKKNNPIYMNLASTVDAPSPNCYANDGETDVAVKIVSPPRDRIEDKIKNVKTIKKRKKSSPTKTSLQDMLTPPTDTIQDLNVSERLDALTLESGLMLPLIEKAHDEIFWKLKTTVRAHLDSVTGFAAHPRDLSVVTVSDDGTAKLFDLSALTMKR